MTSLQRLSAKPITDQQDLSLLAELLSQALVIAVDTESNSLFSYREQVCLIQFSTPEADFLVDPLALEDLSPLGPLFSASSIEKVFHAAEYDLVCLHRDFNFEFNHLFDTMAAARILGRSEVGLGSLLLAEFGVELDKKQQRANWGQRPLPEKLLLYARQDTHYLIQLKERLETELRQRDLLALAQEDFCRLSNLKSISLNGHSTTGERAIDPWRVSGAYDLSPRQAAVLYELCQYRDQVARRLDRPLFKVIGDQTLLAIAASLPQTIQDLQGLPGMSLRQVQRHGNQLLRAVQRGLKAPPLFPLRSARPDDGYLARLDALREWRKTAAQEMGVPSDVVLPRDLMCSLAERDPHDPAELAAVLADTPWRAERFGSQILSILPHEGKR